MDSGQDAGTGAQLAGAARIVTLCGRLRHRIAHGIGLAGCVCALAALPPARSPAQDSFVPRPEKPDVFVPRPAKPVAPEVKRPEGLPRPPKPPPRVQCNARLGGPPDGLIESCTKLIEGGHETGRALAAAYNARGRAYLAKGDHDRAAADFSQALKNEPENVQSLHGRGLARSAKGDLDGAIKDFSDAIWLSPRNAAVYQDRARAYLGKADHARAIADLGEVIKFTPKPAFALRERCYVRAISGRELPQGLDDCEQALRLLKNDVTTLERRGLIHLRLGYFDKAITDFNAVLKVQAANAAALYGRGVAKKKKGLEIAGEADIAEARQLRPDVVQALIAYGVK
jgi:tetratricopeptide (TPR) repeat protein